MTMPITLKRKQIYDFRKKEFIDEMIPSITVKRATRTRSTAARVKVGSHIVGPGSCFQLLYLRICSASFPLEYEIMAKGTPYPGEVKGTIDCGKINVNTSGTFNQFVFPPLVTKDNPKYLGAGSFDIYCTPGSPDYVYMAFEGVEY